jgi:hypothetical protein
MTSAALRRAVRLGGLLALALPATPAPAAISFVASNSASSTTASLAVTKPTGTTTGDVLLATVAGAGTTTISAPAGWTLVDDTTASGSGMRMLTYVKVATATEGTTYTFTSSATRNSSGGISTFRGVNGVVPIDTELEATGASGNAVGPSITTTSANDMVVTAASVARNTTFTPPTGSTERWERAGTSTSTEVSTFAQATAGATGAKSVVPLSTLSPWVAHTVALRDAASAGLSVTLGAATASFTSSLDDGDTAEIWSLPVSVYDTRTSGSVGWQLQITSTALTTGVRTLPATTTDVSGVSAIACGNNAPCTLPTNGLTYPVDVPAAATAPTAVKYFNAASGTGTGRIDLTTGFSANVPQNAYSGTYSSTVTISVVSGP